MGIKKKFIIGKKLGMTQHINDNGLVVPVTVVQCFENEILRFKNEEVDGYNAVVIGYHEVKEKNLNKPNLGQFKKSKKYKYLKEFIVESLDGYELNSSLDPSDFSVGKKYDVQSKTIGRGFTGAIKAWNHQRGPMSHGSKNHRLLGSIGQATTPGNVKLGKRMHTRYGNENVTIKGK